jgi:hypothetical protein
MAEADSLAIINAMGHADIKTAMIYVSPGKSQIREQVERMEPLGSSLGLMARFPAIVTNIDILISARTRSRFEIPFSRVKLFPISPFGSYLVSPG